MSAALETGAFASDCADPISCHVHHQHHHCVQCDVSIDAGEAFPDDATRCACCEVVLHRACAKDGMCAGCEARYGRDARTLAAIADITIAQAVDHLQSCEARARGEIL